jgi:hypothetical protein
VAVPKREMVLMRSPSVTIVHNNVSSLLVGVVFTLSHIMFTAS